jgi:uncharacterized membrane protein
MTEDSPHRARKGRAAGYYLELYFITLVAFLVIDVVWLILVARGFYRDQLGFLMAANTDWIAAAIFYLLFIAGVVVLVVVPGVAARSLRGTLARAALFGLVSYATYDLTNLATIQDWPVLVTVVDLIWGTFVTVAVGAVGFVTGTRLDRQGPAARDGAAARD